jgi:DivIVA domain-containing protein
VAAHKPSKADQTEAPAASPAEGGEEHAFVNLKYYVPQEVLDVSFPVAVRGYDRRAVDAYIKRVNRVIAELKVRSSPPAAVRHALEEAEDKVQGLLAAARDAAEQITVSAQQEAEENTAHAKAEAATLLVDTNAEAEQMKAESDELVANAKREAESIVATAQSNADEQRATAKAEAENIVATAQATADERLKRLEEELRTRQEEGEARIHRLQSDTEAVWNERHELLEDVRRMSDSLVELANAAGARIQHGAGAEPQEDESTQVIEPQQPDEERQPQP